MLVAAALRAFIFAFASSPDPPSAKHTIALLSINFKPKQSELRFCEESERVFSVMCIVVVHTFLSLKTVRAHATFT